jgi:prolyl oligopeptidase
MKQARIRPQVVDDLDDLENVSAADSPLQRGESYFFRKRLAGEQQFSIYVRTGWSGKDKRLVDPAVLSTDPNVSVRIEDVSRDGKMLAYAVQHGGADESSVHVMNVSTGKTMEDELAAARYTSIVFAPDGASLYYARNNKEGTLLYQHVFGTRNARDTLVFGREFRDEPLTGDDLFGASVTDDGRYLVVEIDRGVPAKRVDIVYREVCKDRLPRAQRMHHEGRSGGHARGVEADCARGPQFNRRLGDCGRKNLREPVERREDGNLDLLAGRQD